MLRLDIRIAVSLCNARADGNERFLSSSSTSISRFGYIFVTRSCGSNLKGFEYGSNIIGGLLFFCAAGLVGKQGTNRWRDHPCLHLHLKGFGTDNVSAPPPVEVISVWELGAMMVSNRGCVRHRIAWSAVTSGGSGSQWYYILCLSRCSA